MVVHGTSGPTSYETIPPARLESSGGVLSTVDTIRYEMLFNLRSKADMSQLNLRHGTDN